SSYTPAHRSPNPFPTRRSSDLILDRLEDRELVLARMGSAMAGEREFIFKHVLTRDVAYESLPRRDRAEAHAAVARWIEETAGDRDRKSTRLNSSHRTISYAVFG